MIRYFLPLTFLGLLAAFSVQGQIEPSDKPDEIATAAEADTTERSNSLYALPVVFYTPETSLGFGAAGVYAFNFKDDLPEVRPVGGSPESRGAACNGKPCLKVPGPLPPSATRPFTTDQPRRPRR